MVRNQTLCQMSMYRPNQFNFTFLDAARPKHQVSTTPQILRFSESEEPIDSSVSRNRKINYALEGNSIPRLTNESNLFEKPENQQPQEVEIIEQPHSTVDPEPKERAPLASMRYFAVIDTSCEQTKCRRCGEHGHLQRTCTKSVRESCFYCMGRHFIFDCLQLTCVRCNDEGHKAKDCHHSHGRCFRCGKFGHRELNCGSLVLFEDMQNANFEANDLQRMRCLNCKKKGHVNCHNHTSSGDNLYQQFVSQLPKSHRRKEKERNHSPRQKPILIDSGDSEVELYDTREHHSENNKQFERTSKMKGVNSIRRDKKDASRIRRQGRNSQNNSKEREITSKNNQREDTEEMVTRNHQSRERSRNQHQPKSPVERRHPHGSESQQPNSTLRQQVKNNTRKGSRSSGRGRRVEYC